MLDLLAMDHYRVVSSSPLNLSHLLNDVSHCFEVFTDPVPIPVQNLELGHLMSFLNLEKSNV